MTQTEARAIIHSLLGGMLNVGLDADQLQIVCEDVTHDRSFWEQMKAVGSHLVKLKEDLGIRGTEAAADFLTKMASSGAPDPDGVGSPCGNCGVTFRPCLCSGHSV